jgi:hypothetical protein
MKADLQKQIDEMTEDELEEVLRRDYLRRLTRYRMTDDFYKKKYGNAEKDKLNLALVLKKRRLYGYDSEGGRYHYHPF